MYLIEFKNNKYELIGYSIIDFPQDFKDYPETVDQIIQNSEFYSPKYGITYLELYKEVSSFVEKYGNTYISFAKPEYLFKSSIFIKGTFIYKLYKK